MIKEQKLQFIEILSSVVSIETKNIYLVDMSNMNSNQIYELRRNCYISQVKVMIVKNTFFKKALEKYRRKICTYFSTIKGNTFIMISNIENTPAKIIFNYKKKNNSKIPILKAAYVYDNFYIGNDKLDFLVNLKSKTELIVDILSILQISFKNIVIALLATVYKIIEYLQKNINFNTKNQVCQILTN